VRKFALDIADVTPEDEGRYACKAENDHGLIWGNFTVVVVDPDPGMYID
jgi:hypothetical protein